MEGLSGRSDPRLLSTSYQGKAEGPLAGPNSRQALTGEDLQVEALGDAESAFLAEVDPWGRFRTYTPLADAEPLGGQARGWDFLGPLKHHPGPHQEGRRLTQNLIENGSQ